MCCVCAGTCNHIGNHSYCSAHGGANQPSVYPFPNTTQLAPIAALGFRFTPDQCGESHCFCRRLTKHTHGDEDWLVHKECCNCGIHKLETEEF